MKSKYLSYQTELSKMSKIVQEKIKTRVFFFNLSSVPITKVTKIKN